MSTIGRIFAETTPWGAVKWGGGSTVHAARGSYKRLTTLGRVAFGRHKVSASQRALNEKIASIGDPRVRYQAAAYIYGITSRDEKRLARTFGIMSALYAVAAIGIPVAAVIEGDSGMTLIAFCMIGVMAATMAWRQGFHRFIVTHRSLDILEYMHLRRPAFSYARISDNAQLPAKRETTDE